MRICVLLSSYEHSTSVLRDMDPDPDPKGWLPSYQFETHKIHKGTVAQQLAELATKGYDVFLNLCDGMPDEDTAGIEVVVELERLGLPFTGANSRFYGVTRKDMKRACLEAGLSTPRHHFAKTPEDAVIAQAEKDLRFPLIVKPPDGYCSLGLTETSRVSDSSALRTETARMVAMFGGSLIEEFIVGREYTVLIVEREGESPLVYPPVEFVLPGTGEGFKHFDLKWRAYEEMTTVPVEDEELARRLCELVEKTFVALSGNGYARCDLRVDQRGEPYLLDVNPNPGLYFVPKIYGSSDWIIASAKGGHVEFLERILRMGQKRRRPA